ncbi:MAG TPA: fumarylacetoacetate hydrolase family protein [Plantibacter sp.]|uniref:fumarylacetoacetate hydrolase family protein n=1 Tax=unclassified Plantibacter TaxID=2624265 RepID=UPI002D100686|nr:fumarylacetoacetate hydrolase family protein [Plantibacter sp.]
MSSNDSAAELDGSEELPTGDGKVIAVHLNYPSRAAQRGRTPDQPSYFLKPWSSVALSGETIERPAGAELLAFEGEIAIIIGEPARRVSVEDAWQHVSGVTAANDFGLYDLRSADKGSNLRSKGGDGYTPLGPAIIPAADIDPTALRVRTWVNGDLVQDDTTDTLLFPFARLIADLSQLSTLETGDIILTGTPAGSSVVGPGDIVEVEVDAPTAPGAPSTGRLVTTVVQGEVPFSDVGSKPSVDDHQRVEAWGDAERAGVRLDRLSDRSAPPLDPAVAAQLAQVATATLSAKLRARGYTEVFVEGVHASRPGTRMVGVARTLRFVAYRPDLFAERGNGFNAQKRLFDTVEQGEVIVIEARGERGTGTVGDVLALRAQQRGAAGVVTDGGIRDAEQVASFTLPTFSQGAHPSVLGRRHVPWEIDVAITCGGATVLPGDVIVGDGDGVIAIPRALVAEVAAEAVVQEAEDAWIAEQVVQGAAVDGLFPMNAAWRARYEAARATGIGSEAQR